MANSFLEKYRELIRGLLPSGFAWDQFKEDQDGIIKALAIEFCRIEERGVDLLREIDPGTSVELLEDWEQLLALPDDCSGSIVDLAERQAQARQKLAAQGGISKVFYEELAKSLGFDAIVTDYSHFLVGFSSVGSPLSNEFDLDRDTFRVGRNAVGDILKVHKWTYCFEVNVEATVVAPFKVGFNSVGDPLVRFGNEVLECTIAKLKPAHTCVFFTFR